LTHVYTHFFTESKTGPVATHGTEFRLTAVNFYSLNAGPTPIRALWNLQNAYFNPAGQQFIV
jgi:hypothetical protein